MNGDRVEVAATMNVINMHSVNERQRATQPRSHEFELMEGDAEIEMPKGSSDEANIGIDQLPSRLKVKLFKNSKSKIKLSPLNNPTNRRS